MSVRRSASMVSGKTVTVGEELILWLPGVRPYLLLLCLLLEDVIDIQFSTLWGNTPFPLSHLLQKPLALGVQMLNGLHRASCA